MRRCFNYRTIRQLMLFAAVTQEKSFRRAAKRLNMSVPPLVLQIDELEARLKMKLLERTPRGVSPTAQGNAIMPMIDQLVRQAEILDYSVKQMQQNAQGILTIGANTESMLFFIPEFKKRLAALHPNISLFVKEIDSYQVETELTDGTVLIGMAFFDTLSDQRLRMANLINEKPIVLLNRNHHLAGKGGVSIKDLRNEDFVFTRRSIAPRLFDGLVGFCQEVGGFTPRIIHEVESSPRQMGFVSCGQGIAFLPESFRQWMPEYIRAEPITDAAPCLPLSIAWNPLIESPLRDIVAEELKQMFVDR